MPFQYFSLELLLAKYSVLILDCIPGISIPSGSHQINVEMRKTPLQDGDRLRLQAGVAMNLGLLAVEAGLRPGGDVSGEPSPDKSRKHYTPASAPPQM